MRTLWVSAAACCVLWGAPARAAGPDEASAREALKARVAAYLETTRADLKSDPRYPNLAVNLVSSEMTRSDSLVTPFTAEVNYILEYDEPRHKGERAAHPFLMTCAFFDGRWDISLHGHREMKNLKDLDPKKSRMLYPNI